MNRIFFLLISFLFLSGCATEPADVTQPAFAGLWGLYCITYLVNRLYFKAKERRYYKLVLAVISLIVSFVAPAFVPDGRILYWELHDPMVSNVNILSNSFLILVIGVILGLIFTPIGLIVAYVLKAIDRSKDRFPTLLSIMLLVYLLITSYFLINI